MSDSRYTDQLLLAQMATGSEPAFCRLFDIYWNKVYATALLLTKSPVMAQDIAQEVFLQLWQRREQAMDIEKLEGFLFISARNLVFKKMSRLKLEDAYQQYLSGQPVNAAQHAGEVTEFKELHSIVEAGICKLPPQQQKAFRLSREGGLSHEEISLQMGVSRGAVKDYIVRSISFLRKYLSEHALVFVFTALSFLLKKYF
ncbi:sigma-70 family RNA polymerase sigma factor [uncultured Chitinophaga sp.]|uniref:RNA polymerase sigma factor n=1 Tax=uncultured Chitinophaga sp. TaxID=339340 RepID=UPI0025DC9FAB|nr:sigma-70 family RNA polymerase sigma factor [uncultured Chitinophaga sp.]